MVSKLVASQAGYESKSCTLCTLPMLSHLPPIDSLAVRELVPECDDLCPACCSVGLWQAGSVITPIDVFDMIAQQYALSTVWSTAFLQRVNVTRCILIFDQLAQRIITQSLELGAYCLFSAAFLILLVDACASRRSSAESVEADSLPSVSSDDGGGRASVPLMVISRLFQNLARLVLSPAYTQLSGLSNASRFQFTLQSADYAKVPQLFRAVRQRLRAAGESVSELTFPEVTTLKLKGMDVVVLEFMTTRGGGIYSLSCWAVYDQDVSYRCKQIPAAQWDSMFDKARLGEPDYEEVRMRWLCDTIVNDMLSQVLDDGWPERVLIAPCGAFYSVAWPALLSLTSFGPCSATVTLTPSLRYWYMYHGVVSHRAVLSQRSGVQQTPTVNLQGSLIVGAQLAGAEMEAKAVAARLQVQPLLSSAASSPGMLSKDAVLSQLQSGAVPVFHFCGHSHPRELQLSPTASLTVGDVLSLNLVHTKLVVLSSCSAGQGFLDHGVAEDELSIAHSFLMSGAECVVFSLWPVPDWLMCVFALVLYHFVVADTAGSASIARAVFLATTVLEGTQPFDQVLTQYVDTHLNRAGVLQTELRQAVQRGLQEARSANRQVIAASDSQPQHEESLARELRQLRSLQVLGIDFHINASDVAKTARDASSMLA
jgi:hypothetical protein